MHRYPICVVCDCFIIGTEKIMNLNRKQLLEHENRLSVQKYKEFNGGNELPKELCEYYHLSGFPRMLLSPRARYTKNKGYSCCESCHTAMAYSHRHKNPPKLSIANGFVFGVFPILNYKDDRQYADIQC